MQKSFLFTTFSLTSVAFITWFLVSAPAPGSSEQMHRFFYRRRVSCIGSRQCRGWLGGGLFRLVWMFLPLVIGTRKLVAFSTVLFLWPARISGEALASVESEHAVSHPMLLSILAGIGGGVFSGFMPSTSYFFPRGQRDVPRCVSKPGIGNFGVSASCSSSRPDVVGFKKRAF